MKDGIPNLSTCADLFDRLIIEVNKVAFLENKKAEEHLKPNPDAAKIAAWDKASRSANECRAALKAEINVLFAKLTGNKALDEARTF